MALQVYTEDTIDRNRFNSPVPTHFELQQRIGVRRCFGRLPLRLLPGEGAKTEYIGVITVRAQHSRYPDAGMEVASVDIYMPHHPENVDWYQASAYAAWAGGRLPTEAEWENACGSAKGSIYPWGDKPPATELLSYNLEVDSTAEVGTYPPGANGLYDMAGNVWEWTSSQVKPYPYDATDGRENPEGEANRTLRGGGWACYDYFVRCAFRGNLLPPDIGDGNFGFRLVSPGS